MCLRIPTGRTIVSTTTTITTATTATADSIAIIVAVDVVIIDIVDTMISVARFEIHIAMPVADTIHTTTLDRIRVIWLHCVYKLTLDRRLRRVRAISLPWTFRICVIGCGGM